MNVDNRTIGYVVTATDETGVTYTRRYFHMDKPFAHSSHLVSIMQYLDDEGLDLVSITVS